MRLGAGQTELGVEITGESETGTEGHGGAALDRVGIGVDDLAGHTVGVEGLVALDGVPATGQLLIVILEPLLRVLVVADTESVRCLDELMLLGEEVVELGAILRLQIGPVLGRGQPGVTVGGDDQIRVVVGEFHGVLLQSVANS